MRRSMGGQMTSIRVLVGQLIDNSAQDFKNIFRDGQERPLAGRPI
jgi:hypothetical protein